MNFSKEMTEVPLLTELIHCKIKKYNWEQHFKKEKNQQKLRDDYNQLYLNSFSLLSGLAK